MTAIDSTLGPHRSGCVEYELKDPVAIDLQEGSSGHRLKGCEYSVYECGPWRHSSCKWSQQIPKLMTITIPQRIQPMDHKDLPAEEHDDLRDANRH
jgi:hypothetical protein